MKGSNMWKALMLGGALLLGVAEAGEPERFPVYRGPFGTPDPVEAAKDKIEEKKSQQQLETEARLERLRQAQSQQPARVVVLQWQDSSTDYSNELLRRNVKTRIARPNAKFYPDVDLYQAGRKEPDPTLRPLDQRARVPDSAIDNVMAAVREQEAIPWNGLDETEWGARAHRLKDLAKEMWFVDRPALREPLFLLYTQIGYAAENSNNPGPPFFEEVSGIPVNYYWYLAAAMATMEPSLMSKLTNTEMYGNVDAIKQRLERGDFSPMTLNFELAGVFRPVEFTSEYKVYFHGLEDQITNEQAIYDAPPGIMDLFLERSDGYGMSLRLEDVKLNDQKIYGVRDQARKRMGLDFIHQLMKNPEQCLPDLDGDILNYLAIYQKLHPGAEVYVAIPEGGSVHKILLWKWLPDQATLTRINDNTGGFPIRFVALGGTGLTFSGVSLKPEFADGITPEVLANENATGRFGKRTIPIRLGASGLPFGGELRGHWGRLMVGIGMDFALNMQGDGWNEIPRTRVRKHREVEGEPRILTTDPDTTTGNTKAVVNNLTWQRGAFLTLGGVFGRDAAYGFGPRLAARTGWYNAPRSADITAHAGWSMKPPTSKKKMDTGRRVFPVIDFDVFGGIMLPYGDTLSLITNVQNYTENGETGEITSVDNFPNGAWHPVAKGEDGVIGCSRDLGDGCSPRKVGDPIPTFGFTVKAGLTF